MEIIIAWTTAHPILSWSVGGIVAVVLLLALGYGLFVLWALWDSIDRSGAKLVSEGLTVVHDSNGDVVFTWSVRSSGKFAARDVRIWMSLTSRQKTGHSAAWRFHAEAVALEPATSMDFAIRVARSELARLARDFDKGTVSLSAHHSSSSPQKPPKPFGISGPRIHYALAIGEVGGEACVTVTNFMPIDPYRRTPRV